MHDDEIEISTDLVARLVAGQFPRWAGLPVRRIPSAGTVNAMFRLGDELTVRLPRVPWGVDDVLAERVWLPKLAGYLPVPIPGVVARGRPTDEYPLAWLVLTWLTGTNPVPGEPAGADRLAIDLAGFVVAMRGVDLPGGPPAYRGGPLTRLDARTRAAIAELGDTVDAAAVTDIWDAALRTPAWDGPPTWAHSDLMPGNLLTDGDRLTGVIDFATAGIGDPACDLIVAWNLLPAQARPAFRTAVAVDDATWTRGRARALSQALIALPYYRHRNPTMATIARYTVDQVVADHRST